jgi:hypothetical protein
VASQDKVINDVKNSFQNEDMAKLFKTPPTGSDMEKQDQYQIPERQPASPSSMSG